jgi:hypothetical protein
MATLLRLNKFNVSNFMLLLRICVFYIYIFKNVVHKINKFQSFWVLHITFVT